jgi:hypothetical protein
MSNAAQITVTRIAGVELGELVARLDDAVEVLDLALCERDQNGFVELHPTEAVNIFWVVKTAADALHNFRMDLLDGGASS